MFTRYASAISTSTIMTLGLVYIMQTLIQIQPGVIVDDDTSIPVGFIRIRPIEDPPVTRENEIDKEELIKNVVPPDTRFDDVPSPHASVPIPKQKAPAGPGPTTFTESDGPLVAMITVQPTYPMRAIQRELEGYVIVEFDVDENGRPLNIRVVESSHQVFDRAAIDAAGRIKFKARVVDGNPVTTVGVKKLFRFEMEND